MKEEILEGNELIARFMGAEIWESKNHVKLFKFPDKAGDYGENALKLKYHSSWDWLMDVIDKIDSMDCPYEDYTWSEDGETQHNFMGFDVDIMPKHCTIWEELTLDQHNIVGGGYDKQYNSRIEAAWNAVVEFIKWYNLIQNK